MVEILKVLFFTATIWPMRGGTKETSYPGPRGPVTDTRATIPSVV